ncbi:hypothetical protein CP980_32565 [Streptomyces vinaceus]|uniref:Uncharacterized protein n=1 Tax=Streptomyces vinaceus TaxID=1960 RepID=A0A5J6JHA6_STRVI|nr:hypothetical protein [Streptomyces vinaceus]QEV49181.1 hypothetical protein CP980_32565 [Streptomyces vinaceus]
MTEEGPSVFRVPAVAGRWAPPPAWAGFVLLLLAMFALAYGVGAAAGPIAPGMHSPRTDPGSPGGSDPGGMGGMGGGMHPGAGR